MIEPPSCRDPVRQVTTVSSRSSSWWKLNGRRAEEFLHTEVWVWVIHPWGHPQIIHFCLGFSIINHPLIGVPPILGNHYIIDLSNFFPDDLWNSMWVSFPELLSAQKIISSKAPVFARKETVFSCNFYPDMNPMTTKKQLAKVACICELRPSLSSAAAFDVWQACDSCGWILGNPVLYPTYSLNIGWHWQVSSNTRIPIIVDGEPTINYGSRSLLFMVNHQAIMDVLSLQEQ